MLKQKKLKLTEGVKTAFGGVNVNALTLKILIVVIFAVFCNSDSPVLMDPSVIPHPKVYSHEMKKSLSLAMFFVHAGTVVNNFAESPDKALAVAGVMGNTFMMAVANHYIPDANVCCTLHTFVGGINTVIAWTDVAVHFDTAMGVTKDSTGFASSVYGVLRSPVFQSTVHWLFIFGVWWYFGTGGLP